jgi:hypothetical protein
MEQKNPANFASFPYALCSLPYADCVFSKIYAN